MKQRVIIGREGIDDFYLKFSDGRTEHGLQ